MSKEIINRDRYLDKIIPYINVNLIKVFVGQRRVGKSYLMKMTLEYLKSINKKANYIYIDKELYEFDFINDYHDLIKFVDKNYKSSTFNYVFIDEIQDIALFEKALRHIQNKNNIDIYCTGSNAQMLSGDLATTLSGRYIKIEVNPLSYKEFLFFHKLESGDDAVLKYIKWGGLPFIKHLHKSDTVIFDYLNNIVSTIIYKDILYRYKIRNVEFFDSLILFIAANTSNLITAKKISEYLKSQKIDISVKVVLNYLEYLQNAFLINKVKRVDVNSKRSFEINNKYFFTDWGLRNALLGLNKFSAPDLLENVVFSHLKQLGFTVNIGVLKDLEIDFIATIDGNTIYFQVAYLITDNKVKEREFGNLLKIKDNYNKYVISLDSVLISSYNGIKHLHLKDFLESEVKDL
jgi:predicted AAA+ superfamily ATPase